ncbi:MAG: HAD hydrolase-like protein, partial [Desulfobacterales bacterium]
ALIEKAVARYRERFGTIGLFENEVYDGIPKMLATLQKEGHTLYVATSKPTIFARKIIDHFGLQHFFKGIYGSELDGTRGDKTSLLAHILQTELFTPSGLPGARHPPV